MRMARLLSCLVLFAAMAMGSTYYVSTTGSDAADGTLATPFLTIQKGVDSAAAGDTIIVQDGTYTSGVAITSAGNSSNWITLKAANQRRAIIDVGKLELSLINFNSGSAYWIVDGFRLTNSSHGGVWANDGGANHIRVRNCEIDHIGNIVDVTPYGIAGVFTDSSATDFEVINCIIHDVGRTNTGDVPSNDHNVYSYGGLSIINCVFYNALNGWHIQTANGFHGNIVNNTFYGPNAIAGRSGQIMLWDSNTVIIRNNVSINSRDAFIDSYTPTLTDCSIDHNIVYTSGSTLTLLTTSLPDGCVENNNQLNTDPTVVSAAALNFHLVTGSPAINAGSTTLAPATDIEGRTRTSPPDLGAYEMAASVTTGQAF